MRSARPMPAPKQLLPFAPSCTLSGPAAQPGWCFSWALLAAGRTSCPAPRQQQHGLLTKHNKVGIVVSLSCRRPVPLCLAGLAQLRSIQQACTARRLVPVYLQMQSTCEMQLRPKMPRGAAGCGTTCPSQAALRGLCLPVGVRLTSQSRPRPLQLAPARPGECQSSTDAGSRDSLSPGSNGLSQQPRQTRPVPARLPSLFGRW